MAYGHLPDESTLPDSMLGEPQGEYNSAGRNLQMRMAWQIAELTSRNLFLTGKAGTGKTTFLRTLREKTSKRLIVLAPTGIAAINAGGVTIHSFFQFPLSPYIPGIGFPESNRRFDRFNRNKMRLIKTVDIIVIDEISMVRADLLDAIDNSLRRHRNPRLPFGGVQLLLTGDLQQLPPVVKPAEWEILGQHYDTPFFFSSHALRESGFDTIELSHVYRQSDRHFIELLNRVRTNTANYDTLRQLNQRHIPDFDPDDSEGYIRLTTHNRQAQQINDAKLAHLQGIEFCCNATISGEFPELSYPTDRTLKLKVGAQVMFLRNDATTGYYNGMMGRIVEINYGSVTVRPHGSDDNLLVEPVIWENMRYGVNADSGTISEEVIGSFRQYPLRLAWAITIHKSQGLTFDKAIIDAASSFAHGQAYVALSRCRSLDGMVLESKLSPAAIISDANVVEFINGNCTRQPDQQYIDSLKEVFSLSCLDELFGIDVLRLPFESLKRVLDEYASRDHRALCIRYREAYEKIIEPLEKVFKAFSRQYRSLPFGSPTFRERIAKAIDYFLDTLSPLTILLRDTPVSTANKSVTARLTAAYNDFSDSLRLKLGVMNNMRALPFTPSSYLTEKAKVTLEISQAQEAACPKYTLSRRRTKRTAADATASGSPNDRHLKEALVSWRRAEASERRVPPYVITNRQVIDNLVALKPKTIEELSTIKGVGNHLITAYGDQLLQIIRDYAE